MKGKTQEEEIVQGSTEETTEVLVPQKRKRGRYAVIAVIAVLIVITLLRVLGGHESAPKNTAAEAAALRDLCVSISGSGTIRPIHSSTILGMVSGDILSDSFEIGDYVEKDQILYRIDGKSAETALEQAKLGVEQTKISYDQTKRMMEDLTVKSTVAGQISRIHVKEGDAVSAGMPVATVTDNRTMTLSCAFNSVDAMKIHVGDGATVVITATGETVPATVKSVSAYTEVGLGGTLVQAVELSVKNPGGITGGMEAAARVGEYACQSGGAFSYATETEVLAKAGGTVKSVLVSDGTAVTAGSGLVTLEGDALKDQLKSAELAVKNAELSLKNAEDMAENYNIKAPISGTVTQKDLGAGDNIGQAGTTAMAVISDLSALTFEMKIDELDIPRIRIGQTVKVTVDALPGKQFVGSVDKININGNTANGVTNYPVTVLLENADPELLPGMNVSAEILVEEKEQVLTIPVGAVSRGNMVRVVPADAVQADGSIDESRAREVKVEIDANDSDYVEIISGLSEGDLVLYPVVHRQTPFQKGDDSTMISAAEENG